MSNRAERRRAERAARKGHGPVVDPMAVTFFSNSPWIGTGYGTQTAQATLRMQRDGHAVAIANNHGIKGMTVDWEGIPVFPASDFGYSDDIVEPTFREWSGSHRGMDALCIALFDAWPLKHPGWDRMPVGIWTMVDHLPVPPAVLSFLEKPNVTPLAASQFAFEQITRAGVEAHYVPMAVDTAVYKPSPVWDTGDRQIAGRELIGVGEDRFVVSCVNANKASGNVHRKAWGENLQAFAAFAEGKDDVCLYLHTEPHGQYGGVVLSLLMDSLGIPASKVRIVNQWWSHRGIPAEAMAALFTATDVLLAPTYGEGFGLTVAEAGACETPVIVSDFTCQPELVSGDSFVVGGQTWWDNSQAAWWQIPSVVQTVDALEAAYARGRFRSAAQREHVVANYDADTVFAEHWRPALESMRSKHYADPVVDPIPVDGPLLTIYIPTYRRPVELGRLLASIDGQMAPRVEVVVADDDPAQSGAIVCAPHPWVRYVPRGENLGGDENLQRGYEESSGVFVWMVGDDDWLLPGAVASVLAAVRDGDADRLILLSPAAPRTAAGVVGTPAQVEQASPGISVASTLITANVVRRSALDLAAGRVEVDSMYGWAFSFAGIRRCRVLFDPAFDVGTQHAGAYVASRGKSTSEAIDTWQRLLTAMGVPWSDSVVAWNHVQAARRAA